jgi:hypothetical protein
MFGCCSGCCCCCGSYCGCCYMSWFSQCPSWFRLTKQEGLFFIHSFFWRDYNNCPLFWPESIGLNKAPFRLLFLPLVFYALHFLSLLYYSMFCKMYFNRSQYFFHCLDYQPIPSAFMPSICSPVFQCQKRERTIWHRKQNQYFFLLSFFHLLGANVLVCDYSCCCYTITCA